MLLASLASYAMLRGTRTPDDTNALWANIKAVTVQKRQFCVQRRIGIFLHSFKDASRLKNKFNLKSWHLHAGTPCPRQEMLASLIP